MKKKKIKKFFYGTMTILIFLVFCFLLYYRYKKEKTTFLFFNDKTNNQNNFLALKEKINELKKFNQYIPFSLEQQIKDLKNKDEELTNEKEKLKNKEFQLSLAKNKNEDNLKLQKEIKILKENINQKEKHLRIQISQIKSDLEIEKQKLSTNNEETELKFVHKLAKLGLENFYKGLNQKENIKLKKHYEIIFEADPETFKDKVLNNELSTASTILIYSTIDLLSQKLEKKINLKINGKEYYTSFFLFENEINLELKNINNNHFFINQSNDTLGDGYCFFHAITYLLNEKILDWKSKID